jgi:uncharacterized protein (DUF983 family)
MRSRNARYVFHKLGVGLRLRCPNCELGRMFSGLFHMHPTCPYCNARYERGSGDAVGGVYINVALAELTALIGFFAVHEIFDPPILYQVFIWIPYIILFTIFFYRHARGMWVSILFLTGAVYPDPDYTREYVAPVSVLRGQRPREKE